MNGGYLSESEAFLIGMALGYSQYGDNGLASFRLVEYNSPGAPSLKLQGPFSSSPCSSRFLATESTVSGVKVKVVGTKGTSTHNVQHNYITRLISWGLVGFIC
jgi:hypothetical protein